MTRRICSSRAAAEKMGRVFVGALLPPCALRRMVSGIPLDEDELEDELALAPGLF